ncbi:uncharacterized protein EI97DRAFT_482636 [Westerdykella ornata]|uniref:Rhodopsin domain-containing protein n=1 Tax=Westerdykella ornata TaxID=318751 RepID=A0A6A6JVU7_WESOR|nr:uncharacterized protein EI97DRAFT_482636 [Westerdykella ornata]KAF2279836.1 hypothetical protein EI97DRAFT_482636 [Westerdykella ornata]
MESNMPLVTPQHLGPKVNITVWICFVIAGLAVAAKVLTKLGRSQRHIRLSNLEVDDYILLASWTFAAGQSISISRQVNAGLGEPISNLPADRITNYEKSGYAGQLLYICVLFTAKIAGCLFALNLQPHPNFKIMIHGLTILNVVWAVTSIFGVAFQCKLPRTWAITSHQCVNQPVLWTFIEALNGFTDVALSAILCSIVWILQISKAKFMLLSVFAARILIVLPICFRLIYIYQANMPHNSPDWDPTLKETNVAIATAVLMNATLVLTCVPFLKPLMENLQPGWSTSDVVRGVGYNIMYGKSTIKSGQYAMGSVVSGESCNSGKAAKVKDEGIKRTDAFDLESWTDDGGLEHAATKL